jgi:hypothetical protein
VIHFKHCYAYIGSFCSCGAEAVGGYTGDKPGPDLPLPAAPFNLLCPPYRYADEAGEK